MRDSNSVCLSVCHVPVLYRNSLTYRHIYFSRNYDGVLFNGSSFSFFFLIWGDTRSLHMPALRPASQAGPMCNPREGTSVVLHDTIRLT